MALLNRDTVIRKYDSGEKLSVTEYLIYTNPVYAEYVRCGALDEDIQWNTGQLKNFAEKYANYMLTWINGNPEGK